MQNGKYGMQHATYNMQNESYTPTIHLTANSTINLCLSFLFAAILTGCQNNPPVAYVPQIVVQGYLYANHPIDSIIISRSQPVNVYYNADSAGITGASVSITVEGTTYPLAERAQPQGCYYLADTGFLVRSGKTYLLTCKRRRNNRDSANNRPRIQSTSQPHCPIRSNIRRTQSTFSIIRMRP